MPAKLFLQVPCLLLALACRPAASLGDDLNTRLTQATFKLANPASTATCFVLSRPGGQRDAEQKNGEGENAQNRNALEFLLVTAGHVFDKADGDEMTLLLRKRTGDAEYAKAPLKLAIRAGGKPLWTKHPTADVAVLKIALPPDIEPPRVPVDLLADDARLARFEIHPGDLIRSAGYPHREEANAAGFPLVRLGCVASFPLAPAKSQPTFYVDLNSFEGDSGAAVYMSECNRFYAGATQPGETQLILALVVGQRFLDEETHTIYGSSKTRHRFGLAVVVPAAFIREAIDAIPAGTESR